MTDRPLRAFACPACRATTLWAEGRTGGATCPWCLGRIRLPFAPERTLAEVDRALDGATKLAWARAVDPRNVEKGHWQEAGVLALALHLAEEVGELAQAVRRGTLEQVEHEAGDVVWSVSMLLDAVRRERQKESRKA